MPETDYQKLLGQKAEMEKILKAAIDQVGNDDWYLLETGLREEAISHRLAIYLEQRIVAHQFFRPFKFATDCEYNKLGIEEKTVPNTWDKPNLPKRKKDRKLRPDIIIH